ncbi:MAG: Ig-like domain-containing protein [Proteobacteria bacterium]|nr:Ig-like domain-containing protein [Pseudomonadota bacterium]
MKTLNKMWLMALLLVVFMAGPIVNADEEITDTTPPMVSFVTPENGAIDVGLNRKITATFSEAMDPSKITKENFILKHGTTPVSGTVTYVGVTAIFTPASSLAPGTTYTAKIKTAVKDLAGNPLAEKFVWTFTTGATPDITAPTVSFVTPENGAIDVGLNRKITATFNEAMDPSTIIRATFALQHGTTPVSGTVTYVGVTAIFTPASELAPNTEYTAKIRTWVKDLAGNPLAEKFVWTFTTGPTPDTTAPMVSFVTPENGAIDVALNRKITATFSEAMDPLTITTATFTLQHGTTPVSGTVVTYGGITAIFTPLSDLAPNTEYTAKITTAGTDLAGNPLAEKFVWTFTTGATPDITAPMVSYVTPENGAIDVGLNRNITATFSEAMDPLTITTATFTLQHGTTPVSGTVIYGGITAIFTPASALAPNTEYTATITTGVTDLAGNPLASDFVWSFTTGATPDITAPTVSFVTPKNGATGVGLNPNITATFSEAMDPLTITTATFTLQHGTTPVSGTVTYVGVTAIFAPLSELTPNTEYTATITTAVTDLAGNPLASDFVWSFTTGTTADTTPPTVSFVNPADLATNVAVNTQITATFSEAMDPLTITTATFTLKHGTTPVSGTVIYGGITAIFTPLSELAPNTEYTAMITTGGTDLAGNPLASDLVWSFTTGTGATAGPAPVNLGTAGNFVILAKSGISTTGTTAVVGDMGLSPAAASFITGFGLIMDASNEFSTSSLVTGKIYAADYAPPTPAKMTTAVSDMETAYTDAAGRTLPDFTELGAGNIDRMTLAPGLYKWGTGVTIPIGVTLSGGADDVWIFQIGQDLSVANGAIVTLSGGAQAKNIFWQVAGQATLGTTSDFKGIILCQTAIVLQTGAQMNGRAFAQTAVTLDATAITVP